MSGVQVMAGHEGPLMGLDGTCGQRSHWIVEGQEQDSVTYLRRGVGDIVWTVDEF